MNKKLLHRIFIGVQHITPDPPDPVGSFLLLEDGNFLQQEDGSFIALENN